MLFYATLGSVAYTVNSHFLVCIPGEVSELAGAEHSAEPDIAQARNKLI